MENSGGGGEQQGTSFPLTVDTKQGHDQKAALSELGMTIASGDHQIIEE